MIIHGLQSQIFSKFLRPPFLSLFLEFKNKISFIYEGLYIDCSITAIMNIFKVPQATFSVTVS